MSILSSRTSLILCAVLAAGGFSTPAAASTPAEQFMDENEAAMARMHAAMEVEPTGDIDRDFAAMMIPHHQGGIDMAVAVLRHSRNDQIRRLAQEIIVEQLEEIAALRLAVGEPVPASRPAPTNPSPMAPKAPAGVQTPHHHDEG